MKLPLIPAFVSLRVKYSDHEIKTALKLVAFVFCQETPTIDKAKNAKSDVFFANTTFDVILNSSYTFG